MTLAEGAGAPNVLVDARYRAIESVIPRVIPVSATLSCTGARGVITAKNTSDKRCIALRIHSLLRLEKAPRSCSLCGREDTSTSAAGDGRPGSATIVRLSVAIGAAG